MQRGNKINYISRTESFTEMMSIYSVHTLLRAFFNSVWSKRSHAKQWFSRQRL